MTFSFVIPTYRDTKLLKQCIESIYKYHADADIIVIDDGSNDHIEDMVILCDLKKVQFKTSFYNQGFGQVCNRGIETSDADVVILVNNDIVFVDNITDKLEEIFNKDKRIGIVGGLLTYGDGKTIQHAGHKLAQDKKLQEIVLRGATLEEHPEAVEDKYIVGVTGALFAIRKEMSDQIGIFTQGYYMGYEDCEYCLRAWQTLWRVYYCGEVFALHLEGISRGKDDMQKKEKGTLELESLSQSKYLMDINNYDIKKIVSRIETLNTKQYGKRKLRIDLEA